MDNFGGFLESILRHIGHTVTVFTTSGGVSGSGFTGVLLSADACALRLLCSVGAAPACAVGSACHTPAGASGGFAGNPLGAVAVIPTHAVACFTHNAI
jgi:hypothetical protein